MAGAKKESKNAPTNKGVKMTGKMVSSNDCESCKTQCNKGLAYLERMSIKHMGNGVYCTK